MYRPMAKKKIIHSCTGLDLLDNPFLNKGTAFTKKERSMFHLHGLLPTHVSTVEQQISRLYQNIEKKRTPLGKYNFLMELMGESELLFFQFLAAYPEEFVPIIYTPTVGEAAIKYSEIYLQPKGLYLSYPEKDRLDHIFETYPNKEIEAIVVTDGERILGLGDQGIGGMTIPVGKLALYTLFGGIHPSKTLPILLDVGTNNPALLKDELYLGWRQKRLSGKPYDLFIEQFVKSVKKHFPKVLLQWEDFGKENARRILDKYRDRLLCFNDDIQGTAAVTLAAVLAAIKEAKQQLKDQTIAILGGGSAGTGIADALVIAMQQEGLSKEEACRKIFIVDIDGLIYFNTSKIYDSQKPYVQPQSVIKDWKIPSGEKISLLDVVKNAHPTVLVGVSAQGGAFTKEIVMEMGIHAKRPIIFPLSNPTVKSECTPQEALEWTQGRAIVATGSPFQPVSYGGKTYEIGQCNNVYIFPGVGAGALAARATKVTDEMFIVAARTLAAHSPALQDPTASLFPPISKVRTVSKEIAIAVCRQAIRDGVSSIKVSEIGKRVNALMWTPSYPDQELSSRSRSSRS
jgi:malate dehydrogenase (oxaloacetate-decarboxylating)